MNRGDPEKYRRTAVHHPKVIPGFIPEFEETLGVVHCQWGGGRIL